MRSVNGGHDKTSLEDLCNTFHFHAKVYFILRVPVCASDECDAVIWFPKGAVYLKNCIFKYWKDRDSGDTDVNFYTIPEQAKAIVREHVVNAIIQTPQIIR